MTTTPDKETVTVLVDVTRAWPTSEFALAERVFGKHAASGLVPTIVCFEQQVPDLTPPPRSANVISLPHSGDERLAIEVADLVEKRAASGQPTHAYSLSGLIRTTLGFVERRYPGLITIEDLRPFVDEAARPRYPWNSVWMPRSEALARLQEVMSQQTNGAVYKSSLRSQLTKLDPRFGKGSGGFADSTGFISALVQLGIDNGVVKTQGIDPGMIVHLPGAEPNGLTSPVTPRTQSQEATRPSASTSESQSSLHEDLTRSERFVTLLRRANLGPFMTVRLSVYDEMERLTSGEPPILRELVAEAVKSVRELGLESHGHFPWSRVKSFIERLMSQVAVAKDAEGAPFLFTWESSGNPVCGWVDGWQYKLDGQLILHLLESGELLDLRDVPDLSGALFNGRDEDRLDRVFRVVTTLVEDGHLEAADGSQLTLTGKR